MDFFNKLGETIVSAGKDMTQKTKDLTGIAKIKFEISSKEDELKKLYAQLGMKVYEEHKDDVVCEYDEIAQIQAEKEAIEILKQEEMALRNVKQCPKCGLEVKDSAAFCSACGTPLGMYEEEKDFAD